MNESDSLEDIINKIDNVWDHKSEHYSIEYVTFLIQSDLDDIREDEYDEEESIEELADCVINALRYMNENGYDPENVIKNRLDNHRKKNPKKLVDKYSEKFEEEKH